VSFSSMTTKARAPAPSIGAAASAPGRWSPRRGAVSAALAAASLFGAGTVPLAASAASHVSVTSKPTYVRTIGHSGQALMYPSGLAVDAAGNVVVADTGNDRIQLYPAGSTTPSWTVGVRGAPIGGGTDSFENPRDVAVDANFVYVADTDNLIVQVLKKSDGSYVRTMPFSFSTPIGVSVGSDGQGHERILVSEGGSGKVEVFDTADHRLFSVSATASTEGTRDAATDSNGNIYTADYRGGTVDKYSPTGTLLLRWGGAGAQSCQKVPKPYGIDVDDANHVYVASSDTETVQKFDTSGNCVNVGTTGHNSIGQKGTGPTQLVQLRRVVVGRGASPKVYLADLWGLKILTYNADGTISTTQPELGNGKYPAAGGLNEAHGVSVTSSYVFVTDTINQRMQRFNLDGSNPIAWGNKGVSETTASFNWAQGIGVDPVSGNVWVANTRNNRIDEFAPDGSGPLRSLPPTGRLGSIFNWPMSVSFDPSGNMYVADTFNNQIQSFAVPTSGTPTLRWAVKSAGSGAGFRHPWDLVYDPVQSRVLVADSLNSRIVALSPATGAPLGVLPISRGRNPGQVIKPLGITVSASGTIWIADTGNNRVEEFNSDGSFANEMVGTYGFTVDHFNAPQGIRIGPDGLLYIGDTSNNRIQVYQPV
jgi:tripartite motif-containing protein 71